MSLVTLAGVEGQALLDTVRGQHWPFQPAIHAIHRPQVGRANCGVQSVAMVTSAARLGGRAASLVTAGCGARCEEAPVSEAAVAGWPGTRAVKTQQVIDDTGLTLDEVHSILVNSGVRAQLCRADDVTLQEFRSAARGVLERDDSSAGIIVNYLMGELGQGVFLGHHSPLGAYHEAADRFLILDCWYETEPVWARTADLFRAMDTTDEDTDKKRGYIVVHFD